MHRNLFSNILHAKKFTMKYSFTSCNQLLIKDKFLDIVLGFRIFTYNQGTPKSYSKDFNYILDENHSRYKKLFYRKSIQT